MNMQTSMRRLLLLLALCSLSWLAHGAGKIQFVSGEVVATDPAGVKRTLTKGAPINEGDTVSTGPGARAQLRFSDGALVSLQPNTEFRVDNYRFEGKADGSEKGVFSLVKGGLRTVTGAVGRVNRENYQVNTPVATIGIRGTEYTAALDAANETLVVHTGEGLVEVCNPAGCILLASGESGRVSGAREPQRTEIRPQLPPPALVETAGVTFASSETRTVSGGIFPVSPPLSSGGGYTMAVAFWDSNDSELYTELHSAITATFNSGSELLQAYDSSTTVTGNSLVGAFSADGVIGWGRWATADDNDISSSTTNILKDVHYVIGKPTSGSELTALNGTTATYQMIGYTLPTSTTGQVGQAPSGSLQLSFAGGGVSSSYLSLHVPIGGTTYNLTGSSTSGSGATFSGSGGTRNLYYEGFVSGTYASHAGVTYSFDGNPNGEYISGAVAFKR